MSVTYFKRFRMQINLMHRDDFEVPIENHFQFMPWRENLVSEHAKAKYESFCNELDSHIFPCLGNYDGCLKLMNEISSRRGFVPEATWLLNFRDPATGYQESCGTVQGIREQAQSGAIQNLGVVPKHRGSGQGTNLLKRALNGFKSVGVDQVALEVTVHNEGALELYRRLGFETTKIVYKSIDVPYSK